MRNVKPFPLTLREQAVAYGISEGYSNNQIATHMSIDLKSVERYVSTIYLKLKPLLNQFSQNHKRVLIALLYRAGRIPITAAK